MTRAACLCLLLVAGCQPPNPTTQRASEVSAPSAEPTKTGWSDIAVEYVTDFSPRAGELRLGDVWQKFGDNELAGNKEFGGKRFVFAGAGNIAKDSAGHFFFFIPSAVVCYIAKGSEDSFSKVKPYEHLVLSGVCRGRRDTPGGSLSYVVVFDDCAILRKRVQKP